MNVELGKLADGGLMIMCDLPFPHHIRRVEYYSDQKLILLIYDQPEHEGDLMHYELSDVASQLVEANAQVLIVDCSPDKKLYGYDVSLVKV